MQHGLPESHEQQFVSMTAPPTTFLSGAPSSVFGPAQPFFTLHHNTLTLAQPPAPSPRMLNLHSGPPPVATQQAPSPPPPHLSIVAVLQQQQQHAVEILGPVTNELSLSLHHHNKSHPKSKSQPSPVLTEKKRRTPTIKPSSRIKTFPSVCGNAKCGTTQTPLWRKGWITPEGRAVMLCNACGLHYKKGHYCLHCNQIYKESDADETTNPWIGCDRCSRWVHRNCAVEFNELSPDALTSTDVPYLCNECKTAKHPNTSLFATDSELMKPRKPSKKSQNLNKTGVPKKNKKRPIDNLASSIDAFRDDDIRVSNSASDSESSGLSPTLSSASSEPSFPETGLLTPSLSLSSFSDNDEDPTFSDAASPKSPFKRKRVVSSSSSLPAELPASPTSPTAKPLIDIELKHAKSLLSQQAVNTKHGKMGWLWAVCEWELQSMTIQ